MMFRLSHRTTWVTAAVAVTLSVAFFASAPALAVPAGPRWTVSSVALPTNFSSNDNSHDRYNLTVINVGSLPTDGSTVSITDTLPPGLTASSRIYLTSTNSPGNIVVGPCSVAVATVTCTYEGILGPDEGLVMEVGVEVEPMVLGSVMNSVTVTGGGVPNATVSESTPISSTPPSFGLQAFDLHAYDAGGAVDTQAGDRSYGLSTSIHLNTTTYDPRFETSAYPPAGGHIKDVVVDLPVGLVGNPQSASQCAETQLGTDVCPPSSRVGSIIFWTGGELTAKALYNLIPEHGYPAEFGFIVLGRPVVMFASVRSGSDYGVRLTAPGITREIQLTGAEVIVWGFPGLHNGLGSAVPFFTNPANCSGGPLSAAIHVDSWEDPAPVQINPDGSPNFNTADFSDPRWKTMTSTSPAVTGCDALHFEPTISLAPDVAQAGAPAGLNFDLRVPQSADPSGLATPPVKGVTVTLPRGVSVSPSAAEGLQGCSDAQIALGSAEPESCPSGSQIGTVMVHTPLLAGPLAGQVFVGSPLCGPCSSADAQGGRMLRLFVQVQGSGVVVKLAGTVSADPVTGQLTASFPNNPQLPFDDLQLQLKAGPRAPLANPAACGVFTSTSDISSWGSPFTGDATPSSSFEVVGCGDPGRFAPSFSAGTVNPQAGAFSPFALTFSRQDADQQFSGLSVALPPGLLASLKGVALCSDGDANAGSCPASSRIGSVTAGAGPGAHPFFLGGQVYLTGPYKGGSYGLAVEVPALAGPFNLGTVVVRQSLHVDPHTAQVTVLSDPFPSILDGIPLQVRTVNVTVDRPGFMFNPTNCEALSVGGVLTSTQGASANVSSHFQAANCAALGFQPSFTVSTQARTSKANGASLDVKVGYPSGAQANIHSVAVSLPKQLPSRLTTIQQACPEAVFNQNPASCPAGSDIGIGTATTPVLANPVTGPAYLVSHGGAAFPDVVVILQGEGVTVDLVGSIDIKHGVTSSTFASVPDVPISAFELSLPEGPHSALTTNLPARVKGNLCGQTLAMPTTITGQNGAVVKQSTRIKVTGCAKAKAKKKRKHRANGKGSLRKKGSHKRGR